MAGEENFELDMGLLSFEPEENTTTEVEEVKEEVNTGNEITDAEKQENVGEEVKEKDSKEEDVNDPNSPANSDEELFNVLASSLKERGFFSDLDKEIKSEDDLAEAFKEEIKKNEYADLNEMQKEYLDALREGVPDAVVQEHFKTRNIFESITDIVLESDEDVRKNVIIQDRLASGWTQERADKDYSRIYNSGESYAEALISRDNLKEKEAQIYQERIEQEKKNIVEQQKQAAKQVDEIKQAVFKEDNLFGVFKVNDGLKQKVYETMTKVVSTTTNERGEVVPLNRLMKQRLENPVKFEKDLYYLFTLTNEFQDINKFMTKSNTIAANKLRNAVANSTFIKSGGNSAGPVDDAAYDSPIVSLSTE